MKVYENLRDILKIERYYPFFDVKTLVDEIELNVKVRFDYHYNLSKSFLVEIYIEREWRELYSLHYSKTNYNINNKVARIHFISDKISNFSAVTEKNYLGYITIRPLPSSVNIISRARLKYEPNQYGIAKQDNIKINHIKSTVKLPHISVCYDTFPFTTQDGVVTVCAHSDILMLSKYMYKKFNFNFSTTSSMLSFINQHNGRKIPSQGLLLEQMIEILNKQNYNPSLFRFDNFSLSIPKGIKDKHKISDIPYEEILSTAISSNLPVLFLFENHVVIINGYIEKENGDIEYVIYDDSSYFMKKYFHDSKKYTANINSNIIKDAVKKCGTNCAKQYAIIPTFDRFYFRYKELYILINTKLIDIVKKNKTDEKMEISYKVTLVESQNIVRRYKKYEDILLGHFIWLIRWFDNGIFIGISLVDAAAHKNDFIKSIIEDFVVKQELIKNKR